MCSDLHLEPVLSLQHLVCQQHGPGLGKGRVGAALLRKTDICALEMALEMPLLLWAAKPGTSLMSLKHNGDFFCCL